MKEKNRVHSFIISSNWGPCSSFMLNYVFLDLFFINSTVMVYTKKLLHELEKNKRNKQLVPLHKIG